MADQIFIIHPNKSRQISYKNNLPLIQTNSQMCQNQYYQNYPSSNTNNSYQQPKKINSNIYTTNKKRISTPALLFCKSSSSKSRLSSKSRRSQATKLQFEQTNQYCLNHPKKKATHFGKADDMQDLNYCQKCAILLASQGFNVRQINQKNTNRISRHRTQKKSTYDYTNSRQSEVQGFLSQIQQFVSQIHQKNTEIKDALIASEQFYGEQIQQIDGYFLTLQQSLQLEKNKCYNHILIERQQAEKSIRLIGSNIEQIKKQLQQIAHDIQQNIEAVFQIQENSFRPVINQYKQKLAQFKNGFLKLNLQQLQPIQFRKIQFTGIPESIYSLSDIILKNSVENISSDQVSQRIPKSKCKESSESLNFSFEANKLCSKKSYDRHVQPSEDLLQSEQSEK